MNRYFCHDTNMRHNRKVSVLRKRLGLSGYALWCLVLETLSGAEGYAVRWSEAEAELFAEEYDVEPDVLRTFLDFCLKHGMLIYNKEQGTLACPALMERFAEAEERMKGQTDELAEKRRVAGRNGAQKRWASDGKNGKNGKNGKTEVCYDLPMANDGKNGKTEVCYDLPMANDGKNGKTCNY